MGIPVSHWFICLLILLLDRLRNLRFFFGQLLMFLFLRDSSGKAINNLVELLSLFSDMLPNFLCQSWLLDLLVSFGLGLRLCVLHDCVRRHLWRLVGLVD